MNHKREPKDIAEVFPVGKTMKAYVRDGFSKTLGLWDMKIIGLDMKANTITINISQNWEGADTRGGQHWTETREIEFDDLIIPILAEEGKR